MVGKPLDFLLLHSQFFQKIASVKFEEWGHGYTFFVYNLLLPYFPYPFFPVMKFFGSR